MRINISNKFKRFVYASELTENLFNSGDSSFIKRETPKKHYFY